MTGHFLLLRPEGSPQASLPEELSVGPLRTASPYVRRFSAAFMSRSSVSPSVSGCQPQRF
jgi:hypothetical protein